MSAEKLYSEIFEEFEACKHKDERIVVLKKYDHKHFREFLVCAFHAGIQFDVKLPETYRPAVEPAGINAKLYRFIRNHPKRNPAFSGEKQTRALRVILESLHKDEARLLVKLLQKDLGVKHLTPALIKEAYPEILL
jgi:hypothetical protein